MAKYYGIVGFCIRTETTPGVWKNVIVTKKYYADLNRNHFRPKTAGQVNDNINVQNEISIIADPYAVLNFHSIKYVEFLGTKWKVTSVDVQYPRLILTMGEVYTNG